MIPGRQMPGLARPLSSLMPSGLPLPEADHSQVAGRTKTAVPLSKADDDMTHHNERV